VSLAGLRVVERAGPEPLARAGRYLADLGAEVVVARAAPGPHDRGKRVLAPGPWEAAAERAADVVLGGEGVVGVTMTAPEGGALALEQAAGTYDPPVGRARWHGLAVASTVAAAYAAIAAAAGAFAVERGQPGRAIGVDALAAGLGAHELAALLTLGAPTRWSPLRWAGSPFVASYRAGDGGWVFVHLGLPAHLRRFLRHLRDEGLPEAPRLEAVLTAPTLADPLAVASVREGLRARRLLAAVFRRRPAQAWEDALAAAGLCGVRCRTAVEWREHPQALADEQRSPDGSVGRVAHLRGLGVAAEPGRAPPDWSPRERAPTSLLDAPLAGVRVLDLTRVIAGPVAGRTLAALGARVTKVVDPRETQGWVEAFRAVFDAGKDVVPLDLSTSGGRGALAELLATERPDVVLHNLRPDAATRLGLSEGEVRSRVPDAVMCVISAYGTRGPWAGRPGWEQTAQAVVGTQLEYGGGARPELVPLPATDLATGLFAALGAVAALRGRSRGDGTPWVGVSLSGAQLQLRDGAPTGAPGRAAGLAARLAQVPGARLRADRTGIGPITEIALPWTGPGLARALPGPGAVPGAPGRRSRLRALASTVRWAALVAAGRLPR
jgi:crotonobetainyl-CoA:carnitine CoA-transferase CaiB-like acyl-CoA transferase